MPVSKRKIAYIKEHYRRFNDATLADALELDEDTVREIRKQHSLVRSKADKDRIRDNPDTEPPEYTGQVPIPEERVQLVGRDYLTAIVAALACMAVYFRTLGPTVTGEDAGELVTAAYTLGIAHPPGYPIWCLLGKLFTIIVPFGTVA